VVLGIISFTLPPSVFFLYLGIIFLQMVFVGWLGSKFLPGQASEFLLEIPPFRWPKLTNIVAKTGYRIQWFLKEAVPYFIFGTFILFVLQYFNMLGAIESGLRPVVRGLLGLPEITSKVFIMGFLRRDYGAAGLYDIAMRDSHPLTAAQILTSLVVITLFVPCIANFFIMVKERGVKVAGLMVAFILPYAILVGSVLRVVLQGVGYGR